MATEIIVPKVDMVMESAVFVEWLKPEGEWVEKGEPLFVILTDKANISIEAPASGRLASLRAKPGDTIPVTQVIGYILAKDESLPDRGSPAPLPAAQAAPANGGGKGEFSAMTAADSTLSAITPSRARATPVARRLAKEWGIDLAQVQGRGPRGRVQKADVEAFRTLPSAEPARLETPPPPKTRIPLSRARQKAVVPFTGARRLAAERVRHSAFTAPHISLSLHADMREVIRLRERLRAPLLERTGARLTYTGILARAVAAVLPHHPLLNASLEEDQIIEWEDVHLGIATSLEESLVVPVIREAQHLNLEQLAVQLADLTERAKRKRLTPAEMSGSTFTISNLGMFGIESFTAIINPPESAILAAGKITESPVKGETGIELQPRMNLTVSADHRIADGAVVARFLQELQATLENPYLLL